MGTRSVTDAQINGCLSNSNEQKVVKIVPEMFTHNPKSQFYKQRGKVGSPLTVYKLSLSRSMNGMLGSHTTLKHTLLKTVAFI